VIGRGTIEGALSGVLDPGARIADEAISGFDAFDGAEWPWRVRQCVTIDLACVEYVGGTGYAPLAVVVGIVRARLRFKLLVLCSAAQYVELIQKVLSGASNQVMTSHIMLPGFGP